MGEFQKLLPWLRVLFPPSKATGFNPFEVSEDVSLTHLVFNGSDRLQEFFTFAGSAAAGVATITAGAAPADKFWFVFAASCFHNDPIARDMWLSLVPVGLNPSELAVSTRAVPTNVPLATPRPFIVPPRTQVRGSVVAIAAAQIISLRFQYLELDLGEPPPPA